MDGIEFVLLIQIIVTLFLFINRTIELTNPHKLESALNFLFIILIILPPLFMLGWYILKPILVKMLNSLALKYLEKKIAPYAVRITTPRGSSFNYFKIIFPKSTINGKFIEGDGHIKEVKVRDYNGDDLNVIIFTFFLDSKDFFEKFIRNWKRKLENPDIKWLKKADKDGVTNAHMYVKAGYVLDPDIYYNILTLSDKNGVTVAHLQAQAGYVFDLEKHKEILELKDKKGKSVSDIQNEIILRKLFGEPPKAKYDIVAV